MPTVAGKRHSPPKPGTPDSGPPLDRREERHGDALEKRVEAERVTAADMARLDALWAEVEAAARHRYRKRPPPPSPTPFPPGDPRRLAVMYERYRDGYQLYHERDAREGDPPPRRRPDDPPEPELPT